MWRLTRHTLIGLGCLILIAASAGAAYQWIATRKDLAANPPPGRLVDVGGHRLHIWCTGSGEPTVILEAGLGGPSAAAGWALVQPEVARFARVCSYDRAGIGVFRLLGVSFGGAPESFPPSVQRLARATAFRSVAYQTAADEMTQLRETAAEVRTTRRQLSVPVVVVTAGLGSDAAWQVLQRDLVGLSQRGCQVIAEQSGHVITLGQPQAIVQQIRAVVDDARGRPAATVCGGSPRGS